MRYLEIASSDNSENILLNGNYYIKDKNSQRIRKNTNFTGFSGYLCTQIKTLGISRKHEYLAIENRQFTVENKLDFKKYVLTVAILSKYSEYDDFYERLITFVDKHKKNGFRLYYRPNENKETRYCLCDIISVTKNEKMDSLTLSFAQNSLWFSSDKIVETIIAKDLNDNLFEFQKDTNINDYFCAKFYKDTIVGQEYYCISFSLSSLQEQEFSIYCYNEIPLNFKIYAPKQKPIIKLEDKQKNVLKIIEIDVEIEEDCYIEINSEITSCGVWYVKNGIKTDISDKINFDNGSPFWHIGNGEYILAFQTIGEEKHGTLLQCFYKEEYNA